MTILLGVNITYSVYSYNNVNKRIDELENKVNNKPIGNDLNIPNGDNINNENDLNKEFVDLTSKSYDYTLNNKNHKITYKYYKTTKDITLYQDVLFDNKFIGTVSYLVYVDAEKPGDTDKSIDNIIKQNDTDTKLAFKTIKSKDKEYLSIHLLGWWGTSSYMYVLNDDGDIICKLKNACNTGGFKVNDKNSILYRPYLENASGENEYYHHFAIEDNVIKYFNFKFEDILNETSQYINATEYNIEIYKDDFKIIKKREVKGSYAGGGGPTGDYIRVISGEDLR